MQNKKAVGKPAWTVHVFECNTTGSAVIQFLPLYPQVIIEELFCLTKGIILLIKVHTRLFRRQASKITIILCLSFPYWLDLT